MKKLIVVALLVMMCLILAGCGTTGSSGDGIYNKTLFDTKYSFKTAYVALPDGSMIKGTVKSWMDWDDSDMLQVTLDNGHTYYTHSMNIILETW